jgi:hypothetical protein
MSGPAPTGHREDSPMPPCGASWPDGGDQTADCFVLYCSLPERHEGMHHDDRTDTRWST